MCTKVMLQDTVAAARGLTFFSSPTLLPYALEFPFARIKYRLDTIPLDALALSFPRSSQFLLHSK